VLDIFGLKIASGAIIADSTESIGQAGGDDLMNYFADDRSFNDKQQRFNDKVYCGAHATRTPFARLKTRGYHRRSGKRRFETHPGFRRAHGGTQTDASSPR
jgi:hypothetical protein